MPTKPNLHAGLMPVFWVFKSSCALLSTAVLLIGFCAQAAAAQNAGVVTWYKKQDQSVIGLQAESLPAEKQAEMLSAAVVPKQAPLITEDQASALPTVQTKALSFEDTQSSQLAELDHDQSSSFKLAASSSEAITSAVDTRAESEQVEVSESFDKATTALQSGGSELREDYDHRATTRDGITELAQQESVEVVESMGGIPGPTPEPLTRSDDGELISGSSLNPSYIERTERLERRELPTIEVTPTVADQQRINFYSTQAATPKAHLSLLGPEHIHVKDGAIQPVSFYVYSNYRAYIKEWVLRVYRSDDTTRKRPIYEFKADDLMAQNPIVWDGQSLDAKPLKVGERLVYDLEVIGHSGGIDKVQPRRFSVASSRDAATASLDADQPGDLAGDWYQRLMLRNERISSGINVTGNLITVQGRNMQPNMSLTIAGVPLNADSQGNIKYETHQANGDYAIDVTLKNKTKSLSGKVDEDYFFLAALADLTAGEGRVRGADSFVEPLEQTDYFDEDVYVDGRLAFFLKGKIKGKYLITSQMDTREGKLSDIFDDFTDGTDTDSLLERIDPDRYYPVYGDGSSIENDVNTQGKFYVRVDWDQSKVLWGNYNTNITGTELGSYNRTLYGAQLDYRSVERTKHNDHKVEVTAFASEPNSRAGRDEFLGTGGSLYYLRHQDVVIGSEKLWVEIRDLDNSRILERITLEHGIDYEINAAQGRILLSRPLSSYADRTGPSIVQEQSINADRAYLVAAYEYETDDVFDKDNLNGGGRAKVWLGDFLGVGGMHVVENQSEGDFEKTAADVTLKLSNNSYINVEYAKTQNSQFLDYTNSFDGGLNNQAINTGKEDAQGEAYSVNMRLDFQDVSNAKGMINAWARNQDASFESFNRTGDDYKQYGVEALWELSERILLQFRHVEDRQDNTQDGLDTRVSQVQMDYRVSDRLTLGAEYRRDEEERGADTDRRNYVGVEGSWQFTDATRGYVRAQKQFGEQGRFEDDGSEGDTQYTVGIENQLTNKFTYHAEVSDGDIGTGVRVGASYAFNEKHDFYASLDFLDADIGGVERGFTVGQRSRLSNKLEVFQEYQFDRLRRVAGGGDEDSFDRVWGLRYQLNRGWSIGANYELSDVDAEAGNLERQAGSIRLDYDDKSTHFSNRIEMRKDRSIQNEDTDLYLYAGRLRHIINDEWTYLGRVDLSLAETGTSEKLARYADVQAGMAYRPRFNDKLNMLGLYRYMYDLNPVGQAEVDTDEQSHIVSLDAVYELNEHWELGGKLAYKTSKIRLDRDTGDWVRSEQNLQALRVRYHIIKQWDILGEYRRRDVRDGGTSQGALAEVGYHIGDHMRASVGYNFSDFNDDLADDDYNRGGWFFNLVGKY